MNTFSQDFNFQYARCHAAQTGRQPQLVIITRAAVQANHQAHVTESWFDDVDIGQ